MKERIIDHELSDEEFDKLWEETGKAQEERIKKAQKEWDALSEDEKEQRRIEDQYLDRFWEDWSDYV